MGSSSNDEEGEILERVSEKAPPSLPSVSGHVVDRSSRNKNSRSPSRDYTPPLRDGDDGRPRKRQRSSDRSRTDSRRPDRPYTMRDERYTRRAQVSYADIDSGRPDSPKVTADTARVRGTERHYRDSKRPRTLSRSPPRSPRKPHSDYRSSRRDDRHVRDHYERRYDRGPDRGRERGHDRRNSRDYDRNYGRHDSQGRERGESHPDRHRGKSPGGYSSTRADRGSDKRDRDADIRQSEVNKQSDESMPDASAEPITEPEVVDEERLIEERRKRREAIKAKYKGQGTPLLVSALSSANSPAPIQTPPTVRIETRATSEETGSTPGPPQAKVAEPMQSPRTPMDISREESPASFSIAKDSTQNAVNGNEDEVESSAADFDPVRDMEEEQRRHGQKQQEEGVSAATFNELKSPRDALMPVTDEPKPANAEDDFDMFAEGDDDDDMFAAPRPKPENEKREAGQALPLVAQGKQIEADLLDNWDDPEGYYRVILAEMLDGRYHVQANLGKGSFASVIRAFDTKTERLVAIKMIRNNETLKKAGLKEMAILRKLEEADPEGKKHIVRFERHFEHKGHLCMVFEHLSINLREVLKKFGRDIGINLKAVRAYAQQIFLGLAHLRRCNILHADLKPDNVLVNEGRNILKICDLGSASDASENEITPYLASRFYRAPEIILGVPYDFAIDTWAAGCTLYELYTGKILFTGRSNNQMLKAMMDCRGKFSQKMLKRGHFTGLHFDENLNFRSVEQDKITGKETIRTITVIKPTRELKARIMSTATASGTPDAAELKDLHLFVDLLDKCLNLNPEKRCTPTEALRHPFISKVK